MALIISVLLILVFILVDYIYQTSKGNSWLGHKKN